MCEVRAAIYARTSSDQPLIGHQLEELRARVAEDEVRVPAERELVELGYSGATLVRPGLNSLRELIARGGIDRLYVQSPDRLARTYAHQLLLLNEFQAVGTEVVFVTHLGAAPERMTLQHA
jgi:site-specific DNA recombinase